MKLISDLKGGGGDNMAKKINEADLNEYVIRHQNKTEAEIAKHFGISTSEVSKSYQKYHTTRRPRAIGH